MAKRFLESQACRLVAQSLIERMGGGQPPVTRYLDKPAAPAGEQPFGELDERPPNASATCMVSDAERREPTDRRRPMKQGRVMNRQQPEQFFTPRGDEHDLAGICPYKLDV